jgi:hypothetical protein
MVAAAPSGDDPPVTPPVRLLAVAVALTTVAGTGVLALRRLDRTRPVTVDEAIDRFRSTSPTPGTSGPAGAATATPGTASSSAAPGGSAGPGNPGGANGTTSPVASLPPSTGPGGPTGMRTPQGVYVYATTGYETADAHVSTARHDYPRQTTVTVRSTPCGESVRWDATEDRWDDVTICVDGRTTRVTAYSSYHRFYGHAETRNYFCTGDNWFRPPAGTTRWAFDCSATNAKTHTDATLQGTETVRLGDGTSVKAIHVHYDTTLTGSNRGTNPQDFWLAVDGPYVVRQASRVDADVDTEFGPTIGYHEEYDLVLSSQTPRR